MFALLTMATTSLFSATFQWDNPAGGALDWATNANWSPATGFPNAANDVAIFGTPPMGPLLGNVSVTSGANKTVGQLVFGTNATAFTYSLATGYVINMSATGNPQIQVQTGANPITIASNIGLTGATTLEVNVASGETLTTSGVIASSTGTAVGAAVNCIGQGTWTISGGMQNLFTSGLTVNGGGTVNLAKNINTNAFGGNLTITNNSTVKLMQTHQMGTVILTIDSGGIFDMNSFTEFPVNMNFYNGSVLNATSVANQLNLNQIVLRNVTLNANLRVFPAGPGSVTFDTTNGGTAVIQGLFNLNGNTTTFNVPNGSAAIDMNVQSILSNGSITKTGVGVLQLSGTSTYVGATTVSAGELLVTGSLANTAVTVSSAGTLGGNGTIGTTTASVANQGIVSPGTSPGTLTINGSYSQTAAGALNIDLQTPSIYSKLVVNTGSVSLNGTLNVELLPGNTFTGSEQVTIIDNTAGTGVSGTFSTINSIGFFPGGQALVTYNPKTVVISFSNVPPSPPPQIITVRPTSSASSYGLPQLNNIYNNILNFTRFLNRIRPYKPAQNRPKSPKHTAQNEELLIGDTKDAIGQAHESPRILTLKTSAMLPRSNKNTWGLFANVVGNIGKIYATPLQTPYGYDTVGANIGFDYVGERFVVGASPGYEWIKGTDVDNQYSFTIQSANGTAFGTWVKTFQNFFMDAILSYGWQKYHFSRSSTAGEITGKTTGWQANGYVDAGYALKLPKDFILTPYAGAGYVYAAVDSYQEKGPSSQVFHISEDWLKSLRTFLGLSASMTFSGVRLAFIPEIRGLWMHEFLNPTRAIPFASIPLAIGSQIQVLGPAKNTFAGGGILRFLIQRRQEFYTSYDYEWSGSFHTHLLLGGYEFRW